MPVAAPAGLARQLGIAEQEDLSHKVSGLVDLLRGRDRWLLVYDNAEQPKQLDGLLAVGGGGHVLVTSRWAAWGVPATEAGCAVPRRVRRIPSPADRCR